MVGLVLLTLLVVGLGATAALGVVRSGEVLPGTSVAGVDVGGLGDADAAARLATLADERDDRVVELRVGDEVAVVTAAEVGYELDVLATVEAAMDAGRLDPSLLEAVAAPWRAFGAEEEVEPVERVDEDALRARVEAIAAELDLDADRGDVTIDPASAAVEVVEPQVGRDLDVDATVELVRDALLAGGGSAPATVEADLPFDEIVPILALEDLEAVAGLARTALSRPLVVTSVGEPVLELTPEQLAPVLRLEVTEPTGDEVRGEAELGVDHARLLDLVLPAADTFTTSPKDAGFDVPRAPVRSIDDKHGGTWEPVPVDVAVVPSVPGTVVDNFALVLAVERALAQEADTVEVPLLSEPADFTTADAESYGLTHLLGSFTTYHACCEGRVRNIQRLADVVDGTLVDPGEQFSINQLSGIRTCAKGYAAAGMILDGEIVDVCGGGVSQFGTTTFNAAFFANAQLDRWKAHSFYISRYPRGREATLNFPNPDIDVRFTNTTDHGMLVKTSYTSTSITVAIYGTPTFERTTAIHGEPYRFRSSSTRYKEDKSLPPGESRTVQSGASGFSIDITRRTQLPGGEHEDFGFTTVYVPKLEIIERNTDPVPTPTPTPTPTPGQEQGADQGGADQGGGEQGGGEQGTPEDA